MGSIVSSTTFQSAMTSSGTIGDAFITVGAQGSIVSGVAQAVALTVADDVLFSNAGLVSGAAALSLTGSGGNQDATISNSGTLQSFFDAAITVASTLEAVNIMNTGTIITAPFSLSTGAIQLSSTGAHRIANTGTIASRDTAIKSAGAVTLDNAGTIQGNVEFSLVLALDSQGLIQGTLIDTKATVLQAAPITNGGTIAGTVTVGAGNDSLLNSGTLGANAFLGNGSNTFTNAGGRAIGTVDVGTGNDTVRNSGTIQGDVVLGSGNKTFDNRGGTGLGTVFGGAGNDTVFWEGGSDTLDGGEGRDTMTGGGGTDSFVFSSPADSAFGTPDLITDFAVGSEIIDLSLIDADPLAGGEQAFAFIGSAAFSGNGAQVRFVQDAGTGVTLVFVRLAGIDAPDMEIEMSGLLTLTETNFIL